MSAPHSIVAVDVCLRLHRKRSDFDFIPFGPFDPVRASGVGEHFALLFGREALVAQPFESGPDDPWGELPSHAMIEVARFV